MNIICNAKHIPCCTVWSATENTIHRPHGSAGGVSPYRRLNCQTFPGLHPRPDYSEAPHSKWLFARVRPERRTFETIRQNAVRTKRSCVSLADSMIHMFHFGCRDVNKEILICFGTPLRTREVSDRCVAHRYRCSLGSR
jgi:hypothetical protein